MTSIDSVARTQIDENPEWFAVRVRSNCEWVVAATLKMKGFDVCLPLSRPARHAKRKETNRALFPGYVFCRFDRRALLPILTAPKVVHVVGQGRVLEAVDPVEMHALQKLVASGLPSEAYTELTVGQRVKVLEGPLDGVEGVLIREKGRDRLVLSVTLLARSVVAEVDRTCVEPISFATSGNCGMLARAV